MSRALHVKVIIPHFFREGASDGSGGYGSGRSKNCLARSLSLSRCLGSILSLNRATQDWILNIAEQRLELSPESSSFGLESIHIDVHLFVTGDNWLKDVIGLYVDEGRLTLHQLELEDPMLLPLTSVRCVLGMSSPADLTLYLEDDLVIQDSHYIDKLAWFYSQFGHDFVLMPHRREITVANSPQSFFVDGPIKPIDQTNQVWACEEQEWAEAKYWNGQSVSFSKTFNPHSGSFCITGQQIKYLRSQPWPPKPFVGPLETAATGLVRQHFTILKPSWSHRNFLAIEHGNPSFLGLMMSLPSRAQQ